MKNLKLFVAPLIGAAFLTACGPKPVDVKTFKEKVKEKYNIATINTNYAGKTVHATGTGITGELTTKISSASEDSESGMSYFDFEDITFGALSMVWILSPNMVIESEEESVGKINYFISGDTYTIDMSGEQEGAKGSMKFVFNKDLVVTRSEMKGSEDGISIDLKIDFKYDL